MNFVDLRHVPDSCDYAAVINLTIDKIRESTIFKAYLEGHLGGDAIIAAFKAAALDDIMAYADNTPTAAEPLLLAYKTAIVECIVKPPWEVVTRVLENALDGAGNEDPRATLLEEEDLQIEGTRALEECLRGDFSSPLDLF